MSRSPTPKRRSRSPSPLCSPTRSPSSSPERTIRRRKKKEPIIIEDLFGEDNSDVDEESPKPIHPLRELVQLLEQDEKRRFWFACQDETLFQVDLNDENWLDEATIFVQALLKKSTDSEFKIFLDCPSGSFPTLRNLMTVTVICSNIFKTQGQAFVTNHLPLHPCARRVCAHQNQAMTLKEKAEAADFFHLHRYLHNNDEFLPMQLLGFAQTKFAPSELTLFLCALKIAENPDNKEVVQPVIDGHPKCLLKRVIKNLQDENRAPTCAADYVYSEAEEVATASDDEFINDGDVY